MMVHRQRTNIANLVRNGRLLLGCSQIWPLALDLELSAVRFP